MKVLFSDMRRRNKRKGYASNEQTKSNDARIVKSIPKNEKLLNVLITLSSDMLKLYGTEASVRSKYLYGKLHTTVAAMEKLFRSIMKSKNFNDKAALAEAYLTVSALYMSGENSKEMLFKCQFYIFKCLDLLQEDVLDHRAILIVMKAFHVLASISRLVSKTESTYPKLLHRILELYLNYTKGLRDFPPPINMTTYYTSDYMASDDMELAKLQLYKLHMSAVDDLSTFYIAHPTSDDIHKFIMYTHSCLNRQLSYITVFRNNDYVAWINSTALLSVCLASLELFTEARNHLISICFILWKYVCNTSKKKEKDLISCAIQCEMDQFKSAILAVSWARYGLHLFSTSKNRLLHSKKEDELCITNSLRSEFPKYFSEHTKFIFINIRKDAERFTNLFTDKYVSNYNEAKALFLNILRFSNEAKKIYTREKYLQNNFDIILRICKAYEYFAHFEPCLHKRIKLYKYQLICLREIIGELDPIVDVALRKTIWLQMTVIYSSLLDLYIENVPMNYMDVTMKETHKWIAYLMRNSMDNLQLAMNCFI